MRIVRTEDEKIKDFKSQKFRDLHRHEGLGLV